MTGRNPGQAPTRDNRDIGDREQYPLPAGAMTLPATLKAAGYATGAFGKWGMGGFDSTGSPLKQGFDRFLGVTSQWVAHSHYPPFIQDDGKKVPLDNGPDGAPGFVATVKATVSMPSGPASASVIVVAKTARSILSGASSFDIALSSAAAAL